MFNNISFGLWMVMMCVVVASNSVAAEGEKEIDLTFPNCGKRSPTVEKRHASPENRFKRWNEVVKPAIVGGVTAKANSWPWMAALFLANNPSQLICGGSLISRRYVMTAANCYKPFFQQVEEGEVTLEDIFVVKMGMHNVAIQEDNVHTYSVVNVIIHPGYRPDTGGTNNDITLVELEEEVEFTPQIAPVCLPSPGGLGDRVREDGECTTMGWGKEQASAFKLPARLREVKVQLLSRGKCDELSRKQEEAKDLEKDQICADGETGPCQGDAGGPLVCQLKDDDDTYVQIGVTSYGCAKKDTPDVYTKVSVFTKWIYDNTDLGR